MYGTWTERILRIGLAFAFVYPAVSAWFTPYAWLGYFPAWFLDAIAGQEMLVLHLFGITELLIAAWLIFGKRVFWPSAIALAYLVLIIAFNTVQMNIIFRDISIAALAVALMLNEWSQVPTRRSGQWRA